MTIEEIDERLMNVERILYKVSKIVVTASPSISKFILDEIDDGEKK